MKIVRFQKGSAVSYGVLAADEIEVLAADPFEKIERTGERVPLASVRLLAPVTPPNVLAIGLNYRKHAAESDMKIPERPILFIKANTSVVGPDDPIVLPRVAPGEVDYEAELCVVIGKTARHVPENRARDHILGYTCGNDVSARDCQIRLDGQWARGKSFDTFCPLGPWIETELDPGRAEISTRVNGEVLQRSNTSDLIFNCPQLVAFLSSCMTLLPGTVIMTGTPEGVGFARKPPIFLKPGDVVEIEVAGVGTLKNPVVAE
jgi:2-keto-4-pentenoate hydratase/2-oxohepta-3-ene-1,7-dioic acid hydratase in catechol pathway